MAISQEKLDKVKLLVVDDDQVALKMVEKLLSGFGFKQVTAVDDGRKALKKLETSKVDLVICDLHMPDVSGLDVLREFRAYARYKAAPFIMLTGETAKEKVVEVIKAGVTDYIAKPVKREVLAGKLDGLLANFKVSD